MNSGVWLIDNRTGLSAELDTSSLGDKGLAGSTVALLSGGTT